MKDNFKKYRVIIGIIASLIMAFFLNYFLFKLHLILSLIYDIMIMIILFFHYFSSKKEKFGNIYDIISIVLMAESVIISFGEFKYEARSWIFFIDTKIVNIAPNMLTLLMSISFFGSFLVRNNMAINKKTRKIDLIMLVLSVLFFSSLISVLVSNQYFYIPIIGETNYTAQSICVFFMIISWVGIKSISMFTIPAMTLLSVGRIGEVNKVWDL